MRQELFSSLLVLVQFVCIAILVVTGISLRESLLGSLLFGVGLSIGVWALISMGLTTFSVGPMVRANAQLVERGPYQYVRHPMYAALLLLCGGLVWGLPSLLRVVTWLILAVNTLIKLHFEEWLLQQRFPDYKSYQRGTAKLIPFIF